MHILLRDGAATAHEALALKRCAVRGAIDKVWIRKIRAHVMHRFDDERLCRAGSRFGCLRG
jgi:hypothetical protein